MNGYDFTLHGAQLTALGSGALHWRDQRLLVVSDLHFGKAARLARVGGALLPPYEVRDTITRLEADIDRHAATTVICLGDSFDEMASANDLPEAEALWLTRLMAGRRWIWIAGNHDPAPLGLGGTHLAEVCIAGISFRHIADPAASGEVSGHYHPKARLSARGASLSRACFLLDTARAILPAYGTYTGGLSSAAAPLCALMQHGAIAVLTGVRPCAIPMPRG